MSEDVRFLVDGTARRLARWLRLMGFDAETCEGPADYNAVHRARAEGRILLSRRKSATSLPWAQALRLQSDDLEEQLRQVVRAYGVPKNPVSRCSLCNAPLQEISREEARDAVPPYVYRTAPSFSRCTGCGHTYWQGTHYARIRKRWEQLRRLGRQQD